MITDHSFTWLIPGIIISLVILFIMSFAYNFQMYFMYPISILIPSSIDPFKIELLASENTRDVAKSIFKEMKFVSACFVFFAINITFGFLEGMLFEILSKWNVVECCTSILIINIVLHSIWTCQSTISLENWSLNTFLSNFNTGLSCLFERIFTHVFGALIYYWILEILVQK